MPTHTYHRRSIRLQGYDYAQVGAYFVTICTYNRECLLGQVVDGHTVLNQYGEIVVACWNDLPNHYLSVELDAFVVMPNHVHGTILLADPVGAGFREREMVGAGFKPAPTKRRPLSEIIRAFKTFSSRCINESRGTPGIPTWQHNYYEHVIRDDDSLNRIRDYIATNPLRWALDRENPQRKGEDTFDRWLATFRTWPDK